MRELSSYVDESYRWVNVSDGGHIENLGLVELLRRRCRIIIVGDGEADPNGVYDGLSCAMRIAQLDLGITIDFSGDQNLDFARPNKDKSQRKKNGTRRAKHYAIGKIIYPAVDPESGKDGRVAAADEVSKRERGYLIYLKSCFQGGEHELIQNYKLVNPSFPHETTADQMFDESQFEAYRMLGSEIATEALRDLSSPATYKDLLRNLEGQLDSDVSESTT